MRPAHSDNKFLQCLLLEVGYQDMKNEMKKRHRAFVQDQVQDTEEDFACFPCSGGMPSSCSGSGELSLRFTFMVSTELCLDTYLVCLFMDTTVLTLICHSHKQCNFKTTSYTFVRLGHHTSFHNA